MSLELYFFSGLLLFCQVMLLDLICHCLLHIVIPSPVNWLYPVINRFLLTTKLCCTREFSSYSAVFLTVESEGCVKETTSVGQIQWVGGWVCDRETTDTPSMSRLRLIHRVVSFVDDLRFELGLQSIVTEEELVMVVVWILNSWKKKTVGFGWVWKNKMWTSAHSEGDQRG